MKIKIGDRIEWQDEFCSFNKKADALLIVKNIFSGTVVQVEIQEYMYLVKADKHIKVPRKAKCEDTGLAIVFEDEIIHVE